jgi:hypothetical protein
MMTRWQRTDGVVWEQLGDATLLIAPKTGARWSLNSTAATIWRLCDGMMSLSAMAQELAQASGRSVCICRNDIGSFCAAFSKIGLLTACENGLPTATQSATLFMSGIDSPPIFRGLGVGASGSRRRPSPRGNSGPG